MQSNVAAFLVTTAVAAMAPLAEANVFPAVGGRGDREDALACPAGDILVGFHGRTGSWIDQIGLICATYAGPDYTSGPRSLTPAKGGDGGSYAEQYCPPDAGVRQITPQFLDKDYEHKIVFRIDFACMRPRDGSSAGNGQFGGDLGGFVALDFDLSFIEAPQACVGNEYAVGLNVRHGKHVNAVGLICGAVGGAPAQKPKKVVRVGKKTAAPKPIASPGTPNRTEPINI